MLKLGWCDSINYFKSNTMLYQENNTLLKPEELAEPLSFNFRYGLPYQGGGGGGAPQSKQHQEFRISVASYTTRRWSYKMRK
jgi:hypothetical protein